MKKRLCGAAEFAITLLAPQDTPSQVVVAERRRMELALENLAEQLKAAMAARGREEFDVAIEPM